MIDIETPPPGRDPESPAETPVEPSARILVIGVGGAGNNAVNAMIRSHLRGVDYVVINTDAQALSRSACTRRLQIGRGITRGLGAGADPEIGRDAALEDRDRIEELVTSADMVFVTAGMGGGTGTGAAPVVAEIARGVGALTVGVVTRPFQFEGTRRIRRAEQGIEQLKRVVDTLITIPNNKLIMNSNNKTGMHEAFAMADDVLLSAVRGVTDLINTPGYVNVDFADVRTTLAGKGEAIMGVGVASGDHRAVEATQRAVNSPLLDGLSITGATSVLLSVASGDVTMFEMTEACTMIQEDAHPDAELIWGWNLDPELKDEFRVTVIATGFASGSAAGSPGANETHLAHTVRTITGRSVAARRRQHTAPGELTSGLPISREDYDVPTFVRTID